MAWRQALEKQLPSDSVRVYNPEQFAALLAPEKNLSQRKSKYASRNSPTSGSSAAAAGAAIASQQGSIGSLTGTSLSKMNESTTSSLHQQPSSIHERALLEHKKALKNPNRARHDKLTASQSRLFEDTERKKKAWQRQNEEMLKRVRQKKEARFQSNWTALHAGEGHDLHNEWGHRLELLDAEKQNRKQLLAREWNEKVYNPIMERVQSHTKRLRKNGIHEKRRKEYQNFIEVVNTKGGVFLDEVDEAEYDPGVVNRARGKVRIEGIEDPTIRTLQRHHEEIMMNPSDMHSSPLKKTHLPGGLPPAKGKSTLETTVWGKGQIEATPHGHFAAMHDRDKAAREVVDCAATRVTLGNGYFDHFKMPRSLDLMNKEWANRYGKGKRCTARPKNEIQVGDRIG